MLGRFWHVLATVVFLPQHPEYLQDTIAKSGAILVWQDMTKCGKVSGKELNSFTEILANVFRQKPTMSAGFVTCPILMSERISNNLRDEMRRFEDKFDAKGLANIMVTLRMELPPSSKKVPIVHGWLVVDQSTMSENIFMSSQLVLDRPWFKCKPAAHCTPLC